MAWLPSKTRKGLGYFPGEPDKRDHDIDRLALASPIGKAITHEAHSKVLDQGPTSTCVTNMMAAAVRNAESRAGLPVADVSRLFPYFYSRYLHNGHRRDAGTFLRTGGEAYRRFGVPDEHYWPFAHVGLKVNRQPNIQARAKAYSRIGGKYVSILDPTASGRAAAVRAALEGGYTVGAGLRITRDWGDPNGSHVIDLGDSEFWGGHAVLIVGYTPDQGGLYRIQNSWGDWRDGGFAWITEDLLSAPLTTMELQIIYGWPRLQRALDAA